MQILRSIEEIKKINKPLAVAIGNFDGVHQGHQALIMQCVNESKNRNWASCVLTFEPHPQQVIAHDKNIKLLNTAGQKIRLIEALGVDYLILLPFNRELAEMTAEDFIKDYLVEIMRIKKIFIGFNFFFGRKGSGTPLLLEQLGNYYGFETAILEPVIMKDQIISSSFIRDKYGKGDIKEAAEMLGYWPQLEGTVQSGDARGRKIGFRTANIELQDHIILPAFGVYAALVEVFDNGKKSSPEVYPAVVNIGKRPTFSVEKPIAEAHLLDFTGDLYHKDVRINLLKMLREERLFNNVQELSAQIAKDIEEAKTAIAQHKNAIS